MDGPDGFSGYWHDLRKDQLYFSKRNFGGGSLMVWAAFEAAGTIAIAFVSTKMDSDEYQNVLDEHLTPFWQPGYIYMQDNASIHKSSSTLRYFAHHQIDLLDWPACSPDLNPMENLWGLLVRDVYRNNTQYNSITALKTAILQAWNRVDSRVLANLAMSVPRRLLEVVKASGAATKY